MKVDERGFEDAIEAWLLAYGGYTCALPGGFDPALGLDLGETFAFIVATQPREWAALVGRHGGEAAARAGFARRLASALDERGAVDVLRHGVDDLGVRLRLAFFKPAHGLTPALLERWVANRLTVARQVRYDPARPQLALDMMLSVNGIPVATAELKNPLTGQRTAEAVAQYRRDRDPANVTLGRRAAVHFAVDPDTVAMTTRLAGEATRFLPFNQGSAGPGADGGAGNPLNPAGHRTAYLWQQVWQRDAWLDLLARFVQTEAPAKLAARPAPGERALIFPRYHQWDAVRRLEDAAREHGPGTNYLVQHSAGSGKSNTIGWLAHRLANLHDDADAKVYDKVIVITDRLVLDRQLQDTIYQFEHAHGVVERIDENAAQLAAALAGEQAKIIITTLQKFPYVLDKVGALPDRRYAVIVDEAHSSQTGDAAKELRAVLAAGGEADDPLVRSEREETAARAARDLGEEEDEFTVSVAGRGHQPNLSFFAFTATPKGKTLELFGTPDERAADGRKVAFHLYSMRQAVEEGFILDVLRHYTTYQSYWRIEKRVAEDPSYDKSRAKAAIARFVSLHPHNLAQKAEIIVEHFRAHTAAKIGGRAKAMVVTASRLHAVRYKQALDRHIAARGYTDIAALVAFSGTVTDEGDSFTEAGMNRFPESETATRFAGDDYQVLIVAEKFQTGFDQPLLHTMYVDKVLTGLHAVQTLSRLNRIAPGKTDTFVLDFRNDAEAIRRAFQPYYQQTAAIPTDPNLLWDAHARLLALGVIREDEIAAVVRALLAEDRHGERHGAVYAALGPALRRFEGLDEEEQDAFREALDRFLGLYSFIAQIVAFTDAALERDYLYGKALAEYLPDHSGGKVDIGHAVSLTHLRTELTAAGAITLAGEAGAVRAIYDGHGPRYEPDEERLSEIVRTLNDRYGLNLDEADQLLFDQFEEVWVHDPTVVAQAQNNRLEDFRLVFDKTFLGTVVGRMDANQAIFARILDDADFRATLNELYARRVYDRARATASGVQAAVEGVRG